MRGRIKAFAVLLALLAILAVLRAWQDARDQAPAAATPAPATKPSARASSAPKTPSKRGASVRFSICHHGGGRNCVVDGDTFWMGGVKIRIVEIDAPETHEFKCPAEQARGLRTRARLQALLNSGPVTLERKGRDADRNGRKLRIVKVAGRSVGETLIAEGLARRYRGRKEGWCPGATWTQRSRIWYTIQMTREKSLFDENDPAAELAADARAEADVREGRLISHAAVRRWLASWGSDKPLPRPHIGD